MLKTKVSTGLVIHGLSPWLVDGHLLTVYLQGLFLLVSIVSVSIPPKRKPVLIE